MIRIQTILIQEGLGTHKTMKESKIKKKEVCTYVKCSPFLFNFEDNGAA